jgi:hypothetical protein
MVEMCNGAVCGLPSYALVADPVTTAAARIVDFQSLNLGVLQGTDDGLALWARSRTPPGSDLLVGDGGGGRILAGRARAGRARCQAGARPA